MEQQKRDIWFGKDKNKFTDPRWTAKHGIILALVIIVIDLLKALLFVSFEIPYFGMYSVPVIILGIWGTYLSFKKNAGTKLIILNMLVILLGIFSLIAPVVFITILNQIFK